MTPDETIGHARSRLMQMARCIRDAENNRECQARAYIPLVCPVLLEPIENSNNVRRLCLTPRHFGFPLIVTPRTF